MKTILALLIMSASVCLGQVCLGQGSHWNNGYYRQNGTYVPGHFQTNPNGNPWDNWSTRGNYNPYTGQPGTVNPGGHYYYDASGNVRWRP